MVNLSLKQNRILVESILKQWPSELDGHLSYCVGLSGGIDSVVLLHLLNEASKRQQFELSAIHVNHGISVYADEWMDFCTRLCQQWNIPLQVARLHVVKKAGVGLENSARKLRYTEYQQTNSAVMVLAHHQDDQIETVFSQLMRGSDVHNIAAMRIVSKKNTQFYWRPLLSYTKAQLIDYAMEYKLSHIEDESNHDNNYLRNFLRNSIIPQLLAYDSNLPQKIAQSLVSIQASVNLNDEIAEYDLLSTMKNGQIEIAKIISLSSSRQKSLLCYFIRQHNLPLPSSKQLQEFIRQATVAEQDRHPQLKLNENYILTRRKGSILLVMQMVSKQVE